LLITESCASLPFGGGDAAEPAGETPAFRRERRELMPLAGKISQLAIDSYNL
jgi:hypothetical protein